MKIAGTIWNITILLSIAQWFVLVDSDELANGKVASQSGTFDDRFASRAVDGDESTCCTACSSCNAYSPPGVLILGWVLIDLLNLSTVVNVTLVNSNDPEDRKYMENFTISVGNVSTNDNTSNPGTLCYYYDSSSFVSTRLSVSCEAPIFGRYVTIRRVGGFRSDALSICEAYVYGYLGLRTFSSATTTSSQSSSSLRIIFSTTSSTSPLSWPGNSKGATIGGNWTIGNAPNVSYLPSDVTTIEPDRTLSAQAVAAIIGVVVGVTVIIIVLVLLFICLKTTRCRVKQKPSFLSRSQSHKPIMVEDSSSVYAATSCISDSPGRLINKSNLSNYVNEIRSMPNGFQKEFKRLPDENVAEAKIGQLPDNRLKNRFTNVLPYDHTIVTLEVEEFDDDASSSYINANHITCYKKTAQAYIAVQGPRPNTIDDFWRMIWQKKVNVVVMMTQLIEKTKNKCELYWPEKVDETKNYHKVYVTLVSEDYFADYIDRQMIIQIEEQEHETPRTVRQLQYLSWLDNSRPPHCFQLLSFRRKVWKLRDENTGPIVVHCSSGIGRTGAFIALDYLLDQMTSEGALSVFCCVEELRRQRMNMVQTQDQYEFIYDALVEDIEVGDTSTSCEEFSESRINSGSSNSSLDRQLELLRKMSEPKPGRKSAGLDRENLAKNRNNAIIAYDDSRTYLDVSYISRSDYVNAVSISSYYSAHAYILTQVPLRDTIVDFWRLMWDYDLKTIVLLDDLTENHPKYWSESSGSRTYGPFLVEMIASEQESLNVWRRKIVLTNTKDKHRESICIHQFELRGWLMSAAFDSNDVNMLFELRKQLADHLELRPTPERIVIQCMDGSTKSGLFTAALHAIDRILSETRVDVFLSCRYIRMHRPTAIDSMDHFLFLHEVADFCCRQLNPTDEGQGLKLKRLSLPSLYSSVRSSAPNTSR